MSESTPKRINSFDDVITLTASESRKDIMKLLKCNREKDVSAISWNELGSIHDECIQAYEYLKTYQSKLSFDSRENEAVRYYAEGVDYLMQSTAQAMAQKINEEQTQYNNEILTIANQQRNEHFAQTPHSTEPKALESIELE